MLTPEKLLIYRRYQGDIDGWSRTRNPSESSGMSDGDWYLIEELRQALFLVSSGRASTEFALATEQRLIEVTLDEETRLSIRELAK